MTKRINNRYTAEYKEKAVITAKEIGNVAQTARNLGISYGVLNSWILKDNDRSDKSVGFAESITQAEKIRQLEKKNSLLQEELEIIKKAAAYFAQEELKKNMPRFRS